MSPKRQSARMSKITNDDLTWSGWSGRGCFIAVPIWRIIFHGNSGSQRVKALLTEQSREMAGVIDKYCTVSDSLTLSRDLSSLLHVQNSSV